MGDSENPLSGGGAIAGVVLIALGTLIFLDNIGVIHGVSFGRIFFPAVLIGWGSMGLSRARSAPSLVLPGTAVVGGVLLLLGQLGILPGIRFSTLWPLVLIAAGLLAILSGGEWRELAKRFSGASTQTRLQETAIFSAVKRRVDSTGFEGGELSSVFGGIEVDLRRSTIVGEATLEANAVFGGIELRVPDEWKIVIHGFAAFGAYEDKTVPPRPEPGVIAPVLIVRGTTAFGGVSVRN